jgi:BNR repeat-containing family member
LRALALAAALLVSVLPPVWARGASTATGRAGAAGGPSAHARAARGGTRRRAGPSRAHPRPAYSPFGTLGHGSWSWFGDPRAVYVSGQYDEVFVGWIDWSGDVTVAAYDPSFGVLTEHVVGRMFHDDHSAPSILVEPDKRLTVFWSGHNGSEMYFRSTLRAEDIGAWGPVQHLAQNIEGARGFTYPNPVLLPAEDNILYLFWRGGNWSADYATRLLSGRWSRPHQLIRVPGERPYLKVDSNGRDEIALAFTNGHPRNVLASVYYAAYRTGWLWTAGGRRIAPMGRGPIAPSQADLVYNAQITHVPAWVWDVALDPRSGRPVIVYATFPSAQHHDYWYADWTGTRWASHFLTGAGGTIAPGTMEFEYSGGITLDHSDPSIVYLSRDVDGGYEIERWTTDDGGTSWHHTVVVPPGTDNVRPVVPRGWDQGPMSLLWLHGHYGDYTTYRTSIYYLR